jgi:hypothetical protein
MTVVPYSDLSLSKTSHQSTRCGGALFNAAGSGMAVFANVIAEDVSFK